jgi:hypothetical protein
VPAAGGAGSTGAPVGAAAAPSWPLLRGCYRGQSPCLEGAGEEHGRLEVGRGAHRDVDPNVFREAADEELRLLERGDVSGVRQHRLEAVRKLLDRGVEGKAPQLGQPRAGYRRSKAKTAKFLEALPGRHALVQQEGVVPCLSGAGEVV